MEKRREFTLIVALIGLIVLLLIISLVQLGIQLWSGERDHVAVTDPEPKPQQADPLISIVVTKPEPRPQPTARAEKPFMRTDNTSRVSSTSADLIGFIDPKNSDVLVWFEYGEGISIQKTTDKVLVKSRTSFGRTIFGLNPGTRYSFRIIGKNFEGKFFHGETMTFTTTVPEPLPIPQPRVVVEDPFIRTENVLWVSSTSAGLIGFVDPKGQILVIWLEYGEKNSIDRRTDEISVNSTTSFARRVSGLSPGTEYSFRMVVRRCDGRVFQGNTRSFMTDK